MCNSSAPWRCLNIHWVSWYWWGTNNKFGTVKVPWYWWGTNYKCGSLKLSQHCLGTNNKFGSVKALSWYLWCNKPSLLPAKCLNIGQVLTLHCVLLNTSHVQWGSTMLRPCVKYFFMGEVRTVNLVVQGISVLGKWSQDHVTNQASLQMTPPPLT